MESLRYLHYLAPGGWLVTNLNPMVNIPAYPDIDKIKEEIKKVQNHIILDADKMAADMGSKRSSNMIMLGAATPFIDIPFDDFEQGVTTIFKGKGKEMVEINIKALRQGRQLADDYLS